MINLITGNKQGAVEVGLEEVLESGHWFLSLYNDDGDPHKVGLIATPGSGSGECPQRCNERGHCFLGRCQCHTGYSGHDCSEGKLFSQEVHHSKKKHQCYNDLRLYIKVHTRSLKKNHNSKFLFEIVQSVNVLMPTLFLSPFRN